MRMWGILITFRIYYLVNIAEVKSFIPLFNNYRIEKKRGKDLYVYAFFYFTHIFILFHSSIKHIICHYGRIVLLAKVTKRNGMELSVINTLYISIDMLTPISNEHSPAIS